MPVRFRIPVSFFGLNRNCLQEAGSVAVRSAVKIHSMESRFPSSRFASQSVSVSGWMIMLLMLVLEWLAGQAAARAAVVAAPRVTLVVFADQPIPDEQWTIFAATLRLRFEDLAVETHFASSGFEVVLGDTLAPGAQFEEVISIYLHGECRLHLQPGTYTVHGALGWVLRDHGTIKPFIHVDCARISEMLGQHAFGLDKNSRDAMMAEAVSRVVLHEWLHIATQNAGHAKDGIFKGSFGVADLLADRRHQAGQVSRGK